MSIGDVDDLAVATRTWSGSAPASRTTARAPRGATASTSRPTAARPTPTWASAPPRHINRIVIDPRDNNIVFVAATGSLWGPGGERGVYKTTDGGKTWKQVLKVDDDTGANDLVMDPANSQILYASMYQRRRTACCMNGGGPGSGLWKSTDGGDTWTRLKGGLPDGPLGRIAVDVYRQAAEHPLRDSSRARLRQRGRRRRGGGAPSGAEEGPGAAAAARQAGGGRGGGGRAQHRSRPASIDRTMRARRGGR